MFKRKWFAGKIIPSSELPASRQRTRAWDRAGTVEEPGKDPDFSAGLRMSRNGADYFIENVKRERDTPGNIRRLMLSTMETDPAGTVQKIPIDPGQAGIDQSEQDAIAFSGYRLRFHRPTKDKVARADGFAIQCEFGHVYLVEGEWNEDFLDELCTFPTGSHDDQVDVAADAFNDLATKGGGKFESESSGAREMALEGGRDSRYNFGDNGAAGGSSVGSMANGQFG